MVSDGFKEEVMHVGITGASLREREHHGQFLQVESKKKKSCSATAALRERNACFHDSGGGGSSSKGEKCSTVILGLSFSLHLLRVEGERRGVGKE